MRTSFLMGGEKLFSLPHWYKYTVSLLHKTFYISNFQRCEHAQRKDKGRKREEEVTEEPRRFTMHEMAREFSLFEEALFVFEAQNPKLRMVHEGYNNHSKCNPVPPCHLWWAKESHYPDITGLFYQVDRYNWIQQGKEPVPSTSGVSEIAVAFHLLLMILQLSISHLSFLQSKTLLSCSLNVSCCTIRLKMLSLFFCFYV